MAQAQYSLQSGVATVYSSGDFGFVRGLNNLQRIIVTKNGNTPSGDPVVVNLSNSLGNINTLSSLLIQNGATAQIGGGVLSGQSRTQITINGGILDLRGGVANAAVSNNIVVGTAGGQITVEPTGVSAGVFNVPVSFVDASGNATTKVPANFVMDFPQARQIQAYYDIASNTTTIGDGAAVGIPGLTQVGVGRSVNLRGDVFGLRDTGRAVRLDPLGFLPSPGYTRTFTQSDGNGGVITCFLAGSMIRTPGSDVAVEDLSVGDEITVFVDGKPVTDKVTWVGTARNTVQAHLANDQAGCPVRILKDAIAEGVPSKDLLVTSEHCFLFEGKFVPARMLVNARECSFGLLRQERFLLRLLSR
nr:Hint domain-containing protein [uncultured Neokomagataea sp.]